MWLRIPSMGSPCYEAGGSKAKQSKVQSFDGNAFGDGAVLGCDFVGEVTELGEGVTHLAKGDIVAGLIWGGKL